MEDGIIVWKQCCCSIPSGWLNDLVNNYLIGSCSNIPQGHTLTMLIKKETAAKYTLS